MRLGTFSVATHFDTQPTSHVPSRGPSKSLGASPRGANSSVGQRFEFGQLSEAVGQVGMYRLHSKGPASR
jgi:hypothetical protein